MADRLTKIYTRSGDEGTTGLATGERVPKSSARIDTFGTVDETNSAIGLASVALHEYLGLFYYRLRGWATW